MSISVADHILIEEAIVHDEEEIAWIELEISRYPERAKSYARQLSGLRADLARLNERLRE